MTSPARHQHALRTFPGCRRSRRAARRHFLAVALVGVAAAVIGCGSNAADRAPAQDDAMPGMNGDTQTSPADEAQGHDATMQHDAAGKMALVTGTDGTGESAGGLTLRPERTRMPRARTTWRFMIRDARGVAVTRFERDQTKLLHLIIVRTDLTGYQHLHPTLGTDGRFTIPIALRRPGRYRAIADFITAGKRYALGTTLTAPGAVTTVRLPAPASSTTVDGYRVTLEYETPRPGETTTMTFTISRAGQRVTSLQPYLGAYGHLVALRDPDVAYSHVHPTDQRPRAGQITFDAELAKAGSYRLFMQFRDNDQVRTAAFTVTTSK